MANLGKKNGVFIARFRYNGKEYKRSLKTLDKSDAVAAMHDIQRVLHRLAIGMIQIPAGINPGDFIASGGTIQPVSHREPVIVPTLAAAIAEYHDHLGHLADSTRYTIRVHLNNLQKHLAPKLGRSIEQVRHADLDGFVQARLKVRSSTTVRKEQETLIEFFEWVVVRQYLEKSPAADLRLVKGSADQDPFRTIAEIAAQLSRGGLDESQQWALWDCLYLTPEEISELLAVVKARMRYDVSYLLHAVPAYTGMRRGELLQLRWQDVRFEQNALIARSRKQSRQQVETHRRIDIHPELKNLLLEWREARPKGQFLASDPSSTEPLTGKLANHRFWQPLRGTWWCLHSRRNRFKIGFHTYRHSFASNLAAAGVDQRIIDEWMGHVTESMRKRYRHLFPNVLKSAILSFSFGSRPVAADQTL